MSDIEQIRSWYALIERIQKEAIEAEDLDQLLSMGCALENLAEYVKDAMLSIHSRIREIREAEKERLAHKAWKFRL